MKTELELKREGEWCKRELDKHRKNGWHGCRKRECECYGCFSVVDLHSKGQQAHCALC